MGRLWPVRPVSPPELTTNNSWRLTLKGRGKGRGKILTIRKGRGAREERETRRINGTRLTNPKSKQQLMILRLRLKLTRRKTRGKPPKKCLADSPERDDMTGSFIENNKKESIKYAEEILKSFDMDEEKPERRRKEKKKRRRDNEDELSQPNTKTPRIVIKFSKNKDPPSKNISSDNNGLIKPPGVKDSEGPSLKLPKLKIKNLIEP